MLPVRAARQIMARMVPKVLVCPPSMPWIPKLPTSMHALGLVA